MEKLKSLLLAAILLVVLFSNIQSKSIQPGQQDFLYKTKNIQVKLNNSDSRSVYTVQKFNRVMQRVYLNDEFKKVFSAKNGFILSSGDQQIDFKVIKDDASFTLIKVSREVSKRVRVIDCFDLATGHLHWFGGPEIATQYWPVEKLTLENYSYVTKQMDRVSSAERYWTHSKGGFIYVDDKVPLFVSQNIHGNTLCFIGENAPPYNTQRENFEFVYYLGFAENAKIAQEKAVEHFLNKPTGVPDYRMIQHPIWSTWARFKRDVNETSVIEFAADITKHGFNNSQFEIDDDWETCYGALEFSETKFRNVRKTTDDLHALGYRVTLWIHPFINKGCEPYYSHAKEHGYLVVDDDGNSDTMWWNSKENEAANIDFTNPEAADWFEYRLNKLKVEAGIDSYKFDAGETSWLPKNAKLHAPKELHPSAITKAYVRTAAKLGSQIEVRAAQGTQDLPIFLRMFDKNTDWTFNLGLPTLITTLLQLNMVGYGFILPDMVGGNGYNHKPSKELFIRWLQANVFMPSLQFSYVPWDYDDETIEICKNLTELHAEYAKDIMAAFETQVFSGKPVNAPIWWLDPDDEVALEINDEFLLGDHILSAPVVREGDENRDIYLPKGNWFDPNLQRKYVGPIWLMDYPAPLNVLPYFIRNFEN